MVLQMLRMNVEALLTVQDDKFSFQLVRIDLTHP